MDGLKTQELNKKRFTSPSRQVQKQSPPVRRQAPAVEPKQSALSKTQKSAFKQMLEDLIGTRGAYILDPKLNILGKVPTIELTSTLKSLKSVFAIVFDGTITNDIVNIAERTNIHYIVAMNSKITPTSSKVEILTGNNL